MGLYDDITPDVLRADLRHFAELILRLSADDQLLDATPRLLMVLGDLRAKIFAYEVRVTGRLLPDQPASEASGPGEASRIVEEAVERVRQIEREWARPWSPDDSTD